jgi:hypothetical protein
MKTKFFLILILISSNFLLSQKIDYKNFDEKRASLVLAEIFLKFRDTITTHSLNCKTAKYSDISPDLNKNKNLRKLRWNEWMYENISIKNCQKIMDMGSKIEHPDIQSWFESNHNVIKKEVLKNYKCNFQTYRISYSEVMFQHNSSKYETYEELAVSIIHSLDKSSSHSSILRGRHYSIKEYEKNSVLTAAFACSVKYDIKTNYVKSSLNIIKIE